MSWTKRVRHPKEILTEGDEVEAMILKIDTNQQRISLGLRQTQPDPWSSLPDRFPPGTEVTGPITGITDFGVFMEIDEGIEGLVHISELAHEHIDDISEHFNKGDEITAVILNIDPVEQRASLSRKRLLPFTAGEFGDAMPTGAPQSRGGGRRKGRRGRRGSDIDYDYSYAAADVGAKATTKLGDVYADLFAQFGLAEGTSEEGEETTEPETAAAEAVAEAEAGEAVVTEAETAVEEAVVAEASEEAAEPEAEAEEAVVEAETAGEPVEEEPEMDSADAIDAAEAAALLTAAFREGRRPPRPVEEEAAYTAEASQDEGEAEASEDEGEASEDDSEDRPETA